ncbi:MAG: xanthine dehydrogenase subunit XdhB [Coprococcus sp.]
MYDIESFYEATSVEDAIAKLQEQPDAEIISGGSDVLIKIREGKLAGVRLVSIHNIQSLKGVSIEDDGTIVIGSGTSFSHITGNGLIQQHLPMLGFAVDQVGGPQIRNIGTIGGNVCNGVTSADSASSLFAYNAVLELTGMNGVRSIAIADFYTGPGRTVRQHGEILTAIRIAKKDYEGYGGHYIKYGKRNAMEIATLGCACLVKLTPDKKHVADMRIAYGVAAPTPVRCYRTEEMIRDQAVSKEIFEKVGKGVLEEVNPRSSWRASREFRLQLVEELAKRAMAQAVINAGGESYA